MSIMVLCSIMLNSFRTNKLAGLITVYIMLFVAYRLVPTDWSSLQRGVSLLMIADLGAIFIYGIDRLRQI